MSLDKFNPKMPFVDKEENYILDQAKYCEQLGILDLYEPKQIFYASLNKIPYQNPVKIIENVLDTQGYKINLENILGCIDQSQFGYRIGLRSKGSKIKPVADTFMHTFQFKLPNKSTIGKLLSLFYEELSKHGDEAIKLHKNNQNHNNTEKIKALEADLRDLRRVNNSQQARIDELTRKLNKRQTGNATHLADVESLPDEIKLGEVTKINLQSRLITVRCGKSYNKFPLSHLASAPKNSQACLVAFDGSSIQNVFLLGNSNNKFEKRLCTVLYKFTNALKIRDPLRQEWLYVSKSASDLSPDKIKRGSKVIATFLDNHLVGLTPLSNINVEAFMESFCEKEASYQIRSDHLEQRNKENKRGKIQIKPASGEGS